MPQDAPAISEETQAKIDQIRRDLEYFSKAARQATNVGSAIPTVYADKYAEDVRLLLDLLQPAVPTPVLEESPLEKALADDQAGRTERRRPKP